MNTSIVYTRSRAAFLILFIVYVFVELLAFGMLLDYYPDMDDVIFTLAVLVFLVPLFVLAQITSKASLRLIVYEEYIQFIPIRDNHFVAKPELVLWFDQIRQVDLRKSLVNGSYIQLCLHSGKSIRLYTNLHWLSGEHGFYETYTMLHKIIHGDIAITDDSAIAADGSDVHTTDAAPDNAESVISDECKDIYEDEVVAEGGAIQYYKGNQFLTVGGIWGWGVVLLSILLALYDEELGIGLPVLLLIIVLLPLSTALNYFGIETKYLVVRNHNMFWRAKKFYFKDIREIVLDHARAGVNLTIVTRQQTRKKYTADSLKDKHWLALIKALEAKGVAVHNKTGFQEYTTPGEKKFMRRLYVFMILYFLVGVIVLTCAGMWEPETTAGVIIKGVLVLLIVFSFMFFLRKMVIWLARRSNNSNKNEQDS